MSRLKISSISYLNTAPLMWDFEHGETGAGNKADSNFDVSYTIPSACAEALRAGTADIGIIPVVAIAARRAVRSILLVSKRPMDRSSKQSLWKHVHTVALDTASMTSVA